MNVWNFNEILKFCENLKKKKKKLKYNEKFNILIKILVNSFNLVKIWNFKKFKIIVKILNLVNNWNFRKNFKLKNFVKKINLIKILLKI